MNRFCLIVDTNKLSALYDCIKSNTYVCSRCGNIIFPEVTLCEDDSFDICKRVNEERGGIGNKIVKDNICNECYEKSFLKDEATSEPLFSIRKTLF